LKQSIFYVALNRVILIASYHIKNTRKYTHNNNYCS